ncbi:RNA helicase [Trifolium repens]|nr:RNA helicase [Trifolium repens]
MWKNVKSDRNLSDRKSDSSDRKRVGTEKRRVWRKNDSSSDSDSEDEVESQNQGYYSNVSSIASLGKHDVKRERRVMPKKFDDGTDFSEQVQLIKYEIHKKKLSQNGNNQGEEQENILSQTRFDECAISPLTIKALSSSGYIHMTRVQEISLPICLEGVDVMVKAKTGTGKTAAFLLPAIETVLKAMSSNTSHRAPPIYVLILCPTRELASQLAAEAKVLLKYHDGIGVQTLVGGVRFKVDQKRLESEPCQILVATPGRLLDHIENKSGIFVRLMGLQMLVLDEADHLLDLGFRKDIEKIIDCLPRQRQSLLFSATMPKEVRRISQVVLKREHKYVDTVGMGCVETPVEGDTFSKTSAVSNPLIQVGIPSDREQYIHRLGRTGREGKEGNSILLIAPWEEYFINEIKDIPLEKFPLPDLDLQAQLKIGQSMAKIDNDIKEAAYHAWLGYYNSIMEIGREKTTVAISLSTTPS